MTGVAATSKAAVFEGPGRRFTLRDLPRPHPEPGEVLVRVDCCTLCGSDLHTVRGDRAVPAPSILGHEVVGKVEQLGAGDPPRDLDGRSIAVDDRIVWSITVPCGTCFFCARALPQKCEIVVKYGHAPLRDDRFALSGGLAEHVLLRRGTPVARVPDSLSDAVAAPASCATATAVAALRAGGGAAGKLVLVQGAGLLGLTACALARSHGAASVVVTDLDDARLARARAFGADVALDADVDSELGSHVRALSHGRGADLALEMSGDPGAAAAGLDALRTGGTHVWVGAVFPTDPVPVVPERVVRRLLRIVGVHNYAPGDLREAVRFLDRARARHPFVDLVTGSFALADVDAAFARGSEARALRVAVAPNG